MTPLDEAEDLITIRRMALAALGREGSPSTTVLLVQQLCERVTNRTAEAIPMTDCARCGAHFPHEVSTHLCIGCRVSAHGRDADAGVGWTRTSGGSGPDKAVPTRSAAPRERAADISNSTPAGGPDEAGTFTNRRPEVTPLDVLGDYADELDREVEGYSGRAQQAAMDKRHGAWELARRIANRSDKAIPEVWHHMSSPGVAGCGADYPNMRKTSVLTNVTCLDCLHNSVRERPDNVPCRRCRWPEENHPITEHREGQMVYVLHSITCPVHEGWTPPTSSPETASGCEDCAAMRRQIAISEARSEKAEAEAAHQLDVQIRKDEANDKLRARIATMREEMATLRGERAKTSEGVQALEGERAPHEPALSLADRGSEESAVSVATWIDQHGVERRGVVPTLAGKPRSETARSRSPSAQCCGGAWAHTSECKEPDTHPWAHESPNASPADDMRTADVDEAQCPRCGSITPLEGWEHTLDSANVLTCRPEPKSDTKRTDRVLRNGLGAQTWNRMWGQPLEQLGAEVDRYVAEVRRETIEACEAAHKAGIPFRAGDDACDTGGGR